VEVEEEQIQEIHLGLMVEVVVLADHMLVVVMEVVLVLLIMENQHLVEVLAEQLMVVEWVLLVVLVLLF
tara:strand:- start:995 stop:1201 length:207 start_codon:yes stop_codon:yes gene_type:complete